MGEEDEDAAAEDAGARATLALSRMRDAPPCDAFEWFVMRVEEGLEDFMLDILEELGHPSTPAVVNAAVTRVPEILDSSWFKVLEDDIRGQRAVAEDLKEKLGDFTDANCARWSRPQRPRARWRDSMS